MWQQLNSGRDWFAHDNGAYIYLNAAGTYTRPLLSST
jgi:hypothetical protein